MRRYLLPLLCVPVATACAGDQAQAPPRPVASVTITGADTLLLGQVAQYQAILRDAAGNTLTGRAVDWTSLDPPVATVDQGGLLTVLDTGTVRLSATSEGMSDTVAVPTVSLRFTQVEVGEFESCAVTTAGRVYCWGLMAGGPVPKPVAGSQAFVQLAVGSQRACGLTSPGETWCWTDPAQGATQLPNAPAFASIALGDEHACALDPGGFAFCWGQNGDGRLGTGSPVATVDPTPVSGGLQFSTISAGDTHSCGVETTGAGKCWGGNGNGQLGTGTPGELAPADLLGGLAFRAIEGSVLHTCGIATDSTTWCWGDGNSGELGDNQTSFSITPVPVSGGFKATAIRLGLFHTCALAPGGTAHCWGEGSRGQLGNGTAGLDSVPVAVSGGLRFNSLAAGMGGHTCGLATDSTAYCWGENAAGQLGVPGGGFRTTPVKVTGQR